MSYTQDPSTGTVFSEHGEEIFSTSLRGEAAMTLAKFYDMAFCRGLMYAVNGQITEYPETTETNADQLNSTHWEF